MDINIVIVSPIGYKKPLLHLNPRSRELLDYIYQENESASIEPSTSPFTITLSSWKSPKAILLELFNNEMGRLVDARDIDQLLNEMNFMIENPNFFNSSTIRSYAIKNYSNEEVGKKFNDLYIENCI